MADHRFRLTQGTTVVNLTGGPRYVLSFDLGSAPVTAEEVAEYLADGGDIEAATYANVDMSLDLFVTGANGAEVQANLNAVEQMLTAARDWQSDQAGAPVYFEVQLDGTGDNYRSEVLYGAAQLPEGALYIPWLAKKVTVPLAIRRRFYWEKDTPVELTLTNRHGSGIGGVTVYNHDDAAHDNHVAIVGATVLGVLPAPLKIEFYNMYAAAATTYRVWAGQFTSFGGTAINPTLEGEAGGGASVGDGTCSGGAYGNYTVNTWYALAGRWPIGAALMPTDRTRFVMVLARFFGDPTGINLAALLTFPAGGAAVSEIMRTDSIICDSNRLQMLGPLQLPPWLTRLGSGVTLASLNLDLWARHDAGATMALDFLGLLPLDGWRFYTPSSRGLLQTDVLLDDAPISRQVRVQHVAGFTGYSGLYVPQGPGLYAWPGRDITLYFMVNTDTGVAEIERSSAIRAYYYPRRLTL
jgi:hypothetical protein